MRKLHTSAFDTLHLHGVKEDREQKEERRREEDRQEGGNQIGSKKYEE